MEQYTVRNGDVTMSIELHRDGQLTIDGLVVDYQLRPLAPPYFRLSMLGEHFDVAMPHPVDDEGDTSVYVGGDRVDLNVEDRRLRMLRTVQSERGSRKKASVIQSPMPGRIAKILVGEGDTIVEGQGVVILEAMKMENEIRAAKEGTVRQIKVKENDAVDKNAILIEIS